MPQKIAPPLGRPEVPLSGTAELIAANIRQRRAELAEHAPRAIRWAARAYAAIYERAWGCMAALAGATSPRMLRLRVSAQRSMAIEDLVALADEGPEGFAAAVAGLREIAAALRHRITPEDSQAHLASAHQEIADLAARSGEVLQRAMADLQDGRIDNWPPLRAAFAALRQQLDEAEAACERAQAESEQRRAAAPAERRPH
ncbi:MAG: hypothetical protein KJ067_07190 [Vicinamibacteria bacterium]|nr:hypothetical protein [Vicinamibacteria bacterium]